jgi:ribonuclease P protein component
VSALAGNKQTPWFRVKEVPSKAIKSSFVISIPKNVVSLSTRRSRIKRLIKNAMRERTETPSQGSVWNILVMKQIPKEAKLKDVKAALEKCF